MLMGFRGTGVKDRARNMGYDTLHWEAWHWEAWHREACGLDPVFGFIVPGSMLDKRMPG
jgi:hypothetical protein